MQRVLRLTFFERVARCLLYGTSWQAKSYKSSDGKHNASGWCKSPSNLILALRRGCGVAASPSGALLLAYGQDHTGQDS
jgi:hypothetical protein